MSRAPGPAAARKWPPGSDGNEGRLLQKDQAYQTIKQFIFEEEDNQTVFSERFLSARLEMGLASVRSAVERLRAEGIVQSIPKAGIHLPRISHGEIIEFFEMRLVIEPYIVREISGRLSSRQCDELLTLISDQHRAAVEQDTLAYHSLDLQFHDVLARLHGNREMVRALGQMRDKMFRLSRRIHSTHPERLRINAGQHQTIVEAVCDDRAGDAQEAMRSHLVWGRDFTLDPEGRTDVDHRSGRTRR